MDTLISIIVPVYKVEKELDRCVISLIKQTYKKIEIILVDDGSPDRCPQMCDDFVQSDSRVTVIHKENGGLSDARNYGLRAAKGDYILFVDSDDYLDEEACKHFARYMKQDVDLIIGGATVYKGERIEHQRHSNLKPGIVYSNEDYLVRSISAREWYAPVWHNLYKRRFLIENSLFFRKGILHEDMEYLPRVFLNAKTIIYMDFDFYSYVVREGSITQSNKFDKNILDLMMIYSEWKKQFDGVKNEQVRRLLYGALSKYFIASCRTFHAKGRRYPKGITPFFLLRNSLNLKEFIKAIAFILFRNIYVEL